MGHLSGTSISINLNTSNNQHEWTFTPIKGATLIVNNHFGGNLGDERKHLRQILEVFRGYFPNKAERFEDWGKISMAVNLLESFGQGMGERLFGYHEWGYVKHFFRKQLQQSLREDEPFLVEVITPPAGITPIEFLPVFAEGKKPSTIRNAMDLEAAMRQFPAFSAVVRRVVLTGHPYERDNIIEAYPRLPLKLFYHAGLKGALKEKAFFEKMPMLELRGPWPIEDIPLDQIVETLADHLLDPSKKFQGRGACPPDQIQHFACHCDTSGPSSLEHSITLAHAPKADRRVRIGELEEKIGRRAGWMKKKDAGVSPLIFLNACGSNAMTPMDSTSFLGLFHHISRGMIGTEALVPDQFAAAFSESFYRYLIKHESLGKSIQQARLDMLRRHYIPLGILYTLYADSDIRVGNRRVRK